MQKITTHLWFDTQAKEAAKFYTAAFQKVFGDRAGESKIKTTSVLENTPSGSVDIVTIDLLGEEFTLLAAGPLFKFNPSISFHVACKTKEEVDALWNTFIDGGAALMELGSYPFSERYGWLADKYGLSWQIIYTGDQVPKQKITPVLMFVGNVTGKTEEAVNFYASVFKDSKIAFMQKREAEEGPNKAGTVRYTSFILENKEFGAMDSAEEHKFAFNEAISFLVHCADQKEMDYYWEKLSAVPESEQCGWLKDKFGVSWQIVPNDMDEMMAKGTKEQVARVTEAFLKMKKFDLATLQKAYDGN